MKKITATIIFEVEEVEGLTDSDVSAISYVEELLPNLIYNLSTEQSEENYNGPSISVRIPDDALEIELDKE
jgi:hypothetical protein